MLHSLIKVIYVKALSPLCCFTECYRYDWNIVESSDKHHKPTENQRNSTIMLVHKIQLIFLFKLKVKVLLENVESDSAKRTIYIAAKNDPMHI